MKIVILCGGLGTRLREETEFRPKPLVEIGGRPVLWHIMKSYAHFGFRDFVLCLGYRGSMIKEYFLNYEAMNNDFTMSLGGNGGVSYHGSHLEEGLKVMDATAVSLCMDNGLPIVVFSLLTPGHLRRVIMGEPVGSIVRA